MRSGRDTEGMLAVFGSAMAPELARTLDLGGYAWKAVASPDEAAEHEPSDGWQAFVVECTADAESAWAFLRVLRVELGAGQGAALTAAAARRPQPATTYDDSPAPSIRPSSRRLRHLLAEPARSSPPPPRRVRRPRAQPRDVPGDDLEAPADLTYMEYELPVPHPEPRQGVHGRCCSRGGHEYSRGARTVDVHIRRLPSSVKNTLPDPDRPLGRISLGRPGGVPDAAHASGGSNTDAFHIGRRHSPSTVLSISIVWLPAVAPPGRWPL
jgi:hypothetical protein